MMLFRSRLKNLSLLADGQLKSREMERIRKKVVESPEAKKEFDALIAMEEAMKKPVSPQFKDRVLGKLPTVQRTSQPARGRFVSICGTVRVTRNGKTDLPAFEDMDVKSGDRIDLGKNSLALLELNDRSLIYLNGETTLVIPASAHGVELGIGEIFAIMRRQKKPFIVHTPSAELCVLGTEFDAKVKKETTRLQVLKGRVKFCNKSGAVIAKRRQEVQAMAYATPQTKRLTRERVEETGWHKAFNPPQQEEFVFPMKNFLLFLWLVAFVALIAYFWKDMPWNTHTPRIEYVTDLNRTDFSKSKLSATDLSWADDAKYWGDKINFEEYPAAICLLRPTRFPMDSPLRRVTDSNDAMLRKNVELKELINCAYGNSSDAHSIFPADLPQGGYDWVATKGSGKDNLAALQKMLKEQFGITARKETRPVSAFQLQVVTPNAPGLKPSTNKLGQHSGNIKSALGTWSMEAPCSKLKNGLVSHIEWALGVPVVDKTGLSGGL